MTHSHNVRVLYARLWFYFIHLCVLAVIIRDVNAHALHLCSLCASQTQFYLIGDQSGFQMFVTRVASVTITSLCSTKCISWMFRVLVRFVLAAKLQEVCTNILWKSTGIYGPDWVMWWRHMAEGDCLVCAYFHTQLAKSSTDMLFIHLNK